MVKAVKSPQERREEKANIQALANAEGNLGHVFRATAPLFADRSQFVVTAMPQDMLPAFTVRSRKDKGCILVQQDMEGGITVVEKRRESDCGIVVPQTAEETIGQLNKFAGKIMQPVKPS